MITCPNLSDPKIKQQFEELVEVVGEDEAYFLWSENGGHTLDKTPDGKESKLFKSLLELTDSVEEATKLKAKTYLSEFNAWFGNRKDLINKEFITSRFDKIFIELFKNKLIDEEC